MISVAASLFVKHLKTWADSSLSGFGITNQSGVWIAAVVHRASKRRPSCFLNTLLETDVVDELSENVDRTNYVLTYTDSSERIQEEFSRAPSEHENSFIPEQQPEKR